MDQHSASGAEVSVADTRRRSDSLHELSSRTLRIGELKFTVGRGCPASASRWAGLRGRHVHLDRHPVEITRLTHPRAGEWHGLPGIACHRDPDQVAIADNAVGRIELHPTGAGQIDLAPGMSRAAAHMAGP